ncbi:unnamed protein product [Oreochromis niloticus]|nr:unnamed protein product [Mustela putorius furo]
MEDHMTSSDSPGTGCTSVAMVKDSVGADVDLRVLCDRVEVLEQRAVSAIQPESYLRNRIRELETSERSLLQQLYQLASASQFPNMQHSQRLDQRLHMLREEVRTMTQEKEREERVWRERLQRCQRQLKAKEEEMSRQAQYFENFKTQLQHKLSLAWEREQSLQNRIYTLEKQLLDMTVSAATGMTTIRAVRITGGTAQCLEQDRLSSMRGEGEGEEETKEERRKKWQPSVGTEREERQKGNEGKAENSLGGGRNSDTKQSSNEERLQGFIVSLQEDLRVLLEREEERMTERKRLMEQLQEAQESNHFLSCSVDEMKAEIHQLKLSENSLLEELEQLREENLRLQKVLRDSANHIPSQSSTCLSPETSTPNSSLAVNSGTASIFSYSTAMGQPSVACSGEVQPYSSEVPRVHHQGTAESTQSNTERYSSAVKSKMPTKSHPVNLFHYGSESSANFKSLSLTTESIDEFKLGSWCSEGILNLEESPSEESDALREAYRSLGLDRDLKALQEQCDNLKVALQRTQSQLKEMAEENAQLKLQLRKQAEELEAETEQRSSAEKINTLSTYGGNDQPRSSPTQDGNILALAQDDLIQNLNQENRALADRIQELLAHIERKEDDITKQQTQLMERISQLEEDQVRLEQENREQGCLISELTKKTEDDLNTIMDLQQKLVQGEEAAHLMFNQETDSMKTGSVSGSQHNNHCDLLKRSSQKNHLHLDSQKDEAAQLTNSIQNLKTEQEELTKSINSLREQQSEVALSVQVQTEEKQQLTRTVWGLKEEKDHISKALADLKQEKEQLSRAVCGLRDEREHFKRSMNGLKEEKEQLTKSLSALERDKGAIFESLSSGKEERDEIMKSLQSLQTESDQLSQTVLYLKQERDKLTDSLKCLKEKTDQEQISHSLKEEHDRLMKSVSSLEEEKRRTEHSVSCLKQAEEQIMQVIQDLREERDSLQGLSIQKQTEERNQKQQMLNSSSAGLTKKSEIPAETADCATQRCQTNNHGGNLIQQEENDLMREIETLGAELKRSREEMNKSRAEIKRLQGELRHSETRREEVERKASQAAENAMKLTDVENQMEEIKKENYNLTTQVKELQNKLTGLLREKTDMLSLKAQTEERYNILTAQLKAKTVALEELNSEYIALKRGQGSRDDISTVLVSLRARYNDIRAKYDALLKRKSQTDLDIPPLKAKLSCLVVKCQERNSLLDQMMKILQRQGCMNPYLTQQVEHLLSDAALQEYTAAFTLENNTKTRDYASGFTPEFSSKCKSCTSEFMPEWTCPVVSTSVKKHQQTGVTPEAGVEGRGKEMSIVSTESPANHQDYGSEFTPVLTGSLKKDANSSVPSSPVQEQATVQASASPVLPPNEREITDTVPLSPSAGGPPQAASQPEKFVFHHPEIKKEKSSLCATNVTGYLLSPTIPSSVSFASPKRRLSSPEKILNLHEQLQKTLRSSFEAPKSRGRGQDPRRSPSLSAPADLNKASQTKKLSLSFNNAQINSLTVTTAMSQAPHTPVVTTKPVAANKSPTLFEAVASRSANATFSPSIFTNRHLKADTSALSSSSNFTFSTPAANNVKSILSNGTNETLSSKITKEITAIPDVSYAACKASLQRVATFDSAVTNPKATSSDATAPQISTAPEVTTFHMTSKMDGAIPEVSQSSQLSHCSPERSNKFATTFTARLGKRPKPEAPAEVRSVEVIKTVGQSNLMIGWERPPLDELGCSNGTFVYGYRRRNIYICRPPRERPHLCLD